MRNPSVVLALALMACAHENEPEAVEPETTATSGSIIQGPPSPQSSAPAAPGSSSGPVEEQSMQQQYGAYRDPHEATLSADVPSNAALSARIHDALRQDARVDDSTIALSVRGSTVFVGGYVSSEDQRRVVDEVVAQVPGVTEVFTHALRVRS